MNKLSEPKTYKLESRSGLELEISNLGATILSLKVPNKKGELVNVVVGLSRASDYTTEFYLDQGLYLGSTIGRHAGRISGGAIEIEGKRYSLYNENGIHLHGGKEAFDKKIWEVEASESEDTPSITLSYLSKHLEEGYPGNLKISVTYTLTLDRALKIAFRATTDQTTVLNVTNHAYFNLKGEGSILDHELELKTDSYLDLNDDLIPTGKFNPIKESSYDYSTPSKIGRSGFNGLDDIFILHEEGVKAIISSEESGIQMTVVSNQPAVVIYTPPKFAKLPFKDGAEFEEYPAICFEAQGFPDALNYDNFPSTLLKPSEVFESETSYKFSLVEK
ncbi:aldose epimerase family protein [Lutimonas zeaxanthinifaciens]|uniref:aldose epimerase family protein n=1 Tax=Lutimonas zeaxanthinifaciens TaxID=3060215 RepID=UPI00265CB834|nr:aldose epimerase family protein [Lutimonas sp. YSD2104]WKK66480.1 aldose epimerase family protein [Lutimonas sp. YSD2104]